MSSQTKFVILSWPLLRVFSVQKPKPFPRNDQYIIRNVANVIALLPLGEHHNDANGSSPNDVYVGGVTNTHCDNAPNDMRGFGANANDSNVHFILTCTV